MESRAGSSVESLLSGRNPAESSMKLPRAEAGHRESKGTLRYGLVCTLGIPRVVVYSGLAGHQSPLQANRHRRELGWCCSR